MTDERASADALKIVRGAAIASALVIGATLAVAGRGAEGSVTTRLLVAWILAAPYLVVLLAAARSTSQPLAFGLARGLSLAVIVGTIGAVVLSIVAMP